MMLRQRHDPANNARWYWLYLRTRGFRLSQRFDPVLGSIGVILLFLLVALAAAAQLLRSDQDPLQRVEDRRILASFTTVPGCMMAVAADETGVVWNSLNPALRCQSGIAAGGIAPYNPVWRTWGAEQRPFENDHGTTIGQTLMRLGPTLWVAGNDGGLARLDGGIWRPWLSQTAFRQDGRPVEIDDLVAAAGVGDNSVIFATRDGAVARYEAASARWTYLGMLPGAGTIHEVLALDGALWIGRGGALWWVPLGSLGLGPPSLVREQRVLQMSDNGSSVYVLAVVACSPPRVAHPCRQVIRFSASGEQIAVLLDDSAAPHDWAATDILHIGTLGSDVVMAGAKGVTRYDVSLRQWSSIERRAVTAFASDGVRAVAFAGTGYVARLDAGADGPVMAALPEPRTSVNSLAFDTDGRLHLSDTTGTLWVMERGGGLTPRFRPSAPDIDDPALAVLTGNGRDLHVLKQGAVSMDIATRQYRRHSETDAISTLRAAELRTFQGTEVFTYAAPTAGKAGGIVHIDPADPEAALALSTRGVDPIKSLTELDEGTALATNADGRLLRIRRETDALKIQDVMPGQPTEGLSADAVSGIAKLGEAIVLSGPTGVLRYDPARRAWNTIWPQPANSVTTVPGADRILAVDGMDRLWSLDDASTKANARILVGQRGFSFATDEGLRDALLTAEQDLILLAEDDGGVLRLDAYDSGTRLARSISGFPAGQDAEILSYQNDDSWLVRIGGDIFHPKAMPFPKIAGSKGAVTGWIDPSDQAIVTVEEDTGTGHRFLARRTVGSAAADCLLRHTAFVADTRAEVAGLPGGRTAYLRADGAAIYDPANHRWHPIDLPKQSFDFAAAHGALWAREVGGRPTNVLYRVDLQSVDTPLATCAVTVPPLPSLAFRSAVVDDTGQRVLHLEESGALLETALTGGSTKVLHAVPDFPLVRGQPLRALFADNLIWLAFADGVLAYAPQTRRWTKVAGIEARNWRQVTLERGAGPLANRIVANYSTESAWTRVVMQSKAGGAETTDVAEGRNSSVPPIRPPRGGDFEVIDAWLDGEWLVLRHPRGLSLLHPGGSRWSSSDLDVSDPATRIDRVGGRLIAWTPGIRRFQVQSGTGETKGYTGAVGLTVPDGSIPILTASGLPGWVTPAGGYLNCRPENGCRQVVQDAPLFDADLLDSAIAIGPDLLLRGRNGGYAYLALSSGRSFARIFGTSERPEQGAGLEPWLTESVAFVWPAQNGPGLMLQAVDGAISRVGGRAGQGPESLFTNNHSADVLLHNPDDKVELLRSGALRFNLRQQPLPSWVQTDAVQAVGKLDRILWLQQSEKVVFLPIDCNLISVPEPGSEADVQLGDSQCRAEVLPVPDDQTIAYFKGSFGFGLIAQAKSGKVYRWTEASLLRFRDYWAEEDSFIPPVGDLGPVTAALYERPDGAQSLVRGVTVGKNASELLLPDGDKLALVNLDDLGMPALDLGWLSFDRDRRAFRMGEGDRGSFQAGEKAISASGQFLPFEITQSLPQPDGTVVSVTPFGVLSVGTAPNAAVQRPAQAFQAIAWMSDEVQLDAGGVWVANRFQPFPDGPTRRDSAEVLLLEDLAAGGDRRRPGVSLQVSGKEAWLASGGFAWDRIADHGFTRDGRIAVATSIGAQYLDSPTSAETVQDVRWTVGTFDRLVERSELAPLAADTVKQVSLGSRIAVLQRDRLLTALPDGERLLLATARGVEATDTFSLDTRILQPAAALQDIRRDRPTGLVLARLGGEEVIFDLGLDQLRPVQDAENERLTNPALYRIGPLQVQRSGGSKLRLHLVFPDGSPTGLSALVPDRGGDAGAARLAVDVVSSVAAADGGWVLTVSAAGLSLGTFDQSLAELKLIVPAIRGINLSVGRTDTTTTVMATSAQGASECNALMADGGFRACDAGEGPPRVEVTTALGILTAGHGPRGAAFQLLPTDEGAPLTVELFEGRFSIDRLLQVAACGGGTYFVNAAGLRAFSPDMVTDWPDATLQGRSGPFDRLVCSHGISVASIRDGLWEQSQNNTWTHLAPDASGTSGEVTDFRTAGFTLLGPRIMNRDMLFRRDFSGQLAFQPGLGVEETLNIGGTSELLARTARSSPVLKIDRPRLFLMVGGRYWGVTDDGLIPYGGVAGSGRVAVETDGPRKLGLPAGCVPNHAKAINPDASILFCNGGPRWVFEHTDDGFALLPWRTGESLKNETGALTFSVDPGIGLSGLRLGDEDMGSEVFDGGFVFDTVTGLRAHEVGAVEIVSQSGWHIYRAGTLSLEAAGLADPVGAAFRKSNPDVLATVAVAKTDNPDFTCLTIGSGITAKSSYIEWSNDTLVARGPQRDGPCPSFLAADTLRQHWQLPNGQVTPWLKFPGANLQPDTFKAGRFLADRATSLPWFSVTRDGDTADSISYCAPSAQSGIVIAGDITGPSKRLAMKDCTTSHIRVPPVADDSAFLIQRGNLYRHPLR